MRPAPPPGLALVATREIRWFRRDGVAAFLIIGVPLIAFAVLAMTFSSAVVRGLGVVVVDADRSPTSMVFVQAVAAAPGISVTRRANDLSAATRAILSGEAIAAAYIPADFERDLAAGRRPQIEVFYNTQFMTPGNIAGKGLRDAISAAATMVAPIRGVPPLPPWVGQLVVEQYVLTNPALNYAQFLLRAVLPTVLHVVIAVTTGYAVGSEFSRRSMRAWLQCAGGSPLTALVGKIAPLFGAFLLLMVVLLVIIHGIFGLPFRGDAVMMAAAACLFILAYQSLAALIQLLVGNLALGLSLTAVLVSPAFGYAGVGFPVIGMEGFAKYWGGVLPLRWYIEILFDQAARGSPVQSSAVPFAILGAMAIVFFALAWLRLRSLVRGGAAAPKRRDARPTTATIVVGPGVTGAFGAEWRRVLSDRSVLGLFVIAPLLYGIYYPQPYLGQLLRDVPIAVVDHDRTSLSRRFIQTLDAHEAVKVALRADTLSDAQRALYDRQVFAILDVPVSTEREVLKGNDARLPAYVQFDVLPGLQPHASGHLRGGGSDDGRSRLARPADRGRDLQDRAGSAEPNRTVDGAVIQPDWRLRKLCGARRVRVDPAADAPDGSGNARRRRIRGRRQSRSYRAGLDCRGARARHRPPYNIHRAGGLPPCDLASGLWLLDAGSSVRSVPFCGTLCAGNELHGTGCRRLF